MKDYLDIINEYLGDYSESIRLEKDLNEAGYSILPTKEMSLNDL